MNKLKLLAKNPLMSGSMIMIGGSLAANAINYLYHLLMGKMLGVVDYGALASIFSVLYIVSIVPLSTSVSIVKFISSAKDTKEITRTYWGIKKFLGKIALVGTVLLILSTPLIATFLHIDQLLAVALVGPIFYFSLIGLVNQATAQGLLSFVGVTGPNFVSSIGKLILGIVLVLLGFSVTGALWGVLAGVVLAYYYSTLFVRKIKKDKSTEFDLRPFLRFSTPALVQALAFTSIFTVDLILVKHYLSPQEAGAYAALSILGKIIFFASSPVTSVMFPVVSGKRSRGEAYKKVFLLVLFVNIVISAGLVSLYALLPEFVITTLYSSSYLHAAGSLVWMGIFIALYSLAQLLVNYALAVGSEKTGFLPLIAAIIQIICIVFLHSSILEVIQVSLFVIVGLLLAVSVSLGLYNKKQL